VPGALKQHLTKGTCEMFWLVFYGNPKFKKGGPLGRETIHFLAQNCEIKEKPLWANPIKVSPKEGKQYIVQLCWTGNVECSHWDLQEGPNEGWELRSRFALNNKKKKMEKKININEKTFKIEGNWTILQACEKIGLYIPRFCYNEALSIAGNCRMCLVEIEKTPKLMPACAIQITNEMKIKTKTNLVKKTRESILEFLLINHPLDCPICDQGGECDLQDQAMIYGSDRGRFYEYKRAVQDKNAGPLIKTIMTRCIHCTRCIRFATEIAGIETYGTTGRGKGMEVGTYIGKIFDSELSGNVIDLCPVGALTSKQYAFKVRPWELKSIETIDILDSVGTNIRIDTRGSEIMRILPRTNGPIKEQWISDKTRFAHDGLKNQRIKYPMIKKDKGYVTVSWKEAIKYIGDIIINTKAEKISGIIGQFIDQETIKIIKKKWNERGIEKIELQQPYGSWENIDIREKYIFEMKGQMDTKDIKSTGNQEPYETIIIGANPRKEATIINIRLRRIMMTKKNEKIKIKTIGNAMDLTYETKQIGKGIETIYETILGKNKLTKEIIQTKNPTAIIGINTIQRRDGKTIEEILKDTFKKWKKINNIMKEWQNTEEKAEQPNVVKKKERKYHNITKKYIITNAQKELNKEEEEEKRINILHGNASITGALEIGIGNYKKRWKENQLEVKVEPSLVTPLLDRPVVYLIGADLEKWQKINEKGEKGNNSDWQQEELLTNTNVLSSTKETLKIYQGHHGNQGAKEANIIIPSTTYIEKKGTYINIEGIVQETQPVIEKEKGIYNDKIIIEKIWNYIEEEEKKKEKNQEKKDKKNERETSAIIGQITRKGKQKMACPIDISVGMEYGQCPHWHEEKPNWKGEYAIKKIIKETLKEDIGKGGRHAFVGMPNSPKGTQWEKDMNPLWKKETKKKEGEKGKKLTTEIKPKKIISNKKYNKIYKENINVLGDNYYLADVITKASITMAKCSALNKTKQNNFPK
jgi:NADH-quinone oxidoreductase subunit G